jgi:hypothetical protein
LGVEMHRVPAGRLNAFKRGYRILLSSIVPLGRGSIGL